MHLPAKPQSATQSSSLPYRSRWYLACGGFGRAGASTSLLAATATLGLLCKSLDRLQPATTGTVRTSATRTGVGENASRMASPTRLRTGPDTSPPRDRACGSALVGHQYDFG